ncbi:hypothetical protein Tco_0193700 [Tanacetum coccineum]
MWMVSKASLLEDGALSQCLSSSDLPLSLKLRLFLDPSLVSKLPPRLRDPQIDAINVGHSLLNELASTSAVSLSSLTL